MNHRRLSGYSLIEVTLVVSFAAALLAITLSRAGSFIDRIEVRGAVTEIESMFSLARHVAIARGAQATLDVDGTARTLSIRVGSEMVQMREVGKAHGVSISSNRSSITYTPIGVGYGAANLSLIVTRGRAADTIVVSRLGRVRH